MRSPRLLAGLTLTALLLTSCGGSDDVPQITVRNALQAPFYALQLTGLYTPLNRPSAALGVFASVYLSQGGSLPTRSALAGIQAAQSLIQPLNPDNLDDAYLLLQEFGSVLQVDVPEMLNAQTDRAGALNEYVTGLRNITIRAQLKEQEIANAIDAREETRRTQQKTLSAIRSQIQKALRDEDYASAGALQPQANTAQVALEKTQSEIDRLNDVGDLYDRLLDIATERYAAIEQNRAPLISGVQVVQVPGVEDLDVLLRGRRINRGEDTLFNNNFDSNTGGTGGAGGLNTEGLEELDGRLF